MQAICRAVTRPLRLPLLTLVALVAARPAAAQLCTASATGLVFGTVAPSGATPSDITASISVSCLTTLPVAVSYFVQLTAGTGTSVANRSMGSLGGRLNYQVYLDASRSTIWGDGTGGSGTMSDSYGLGLLGSATKTYTAYGRIPGNQLVAPNLYSDLLTIIVTY